LGVLPAVQEDTQGRQVLTLDANARGGGTRRAGLAIIIYYYQLLCLLRRPKPGYPSIVGSSLLFISTAAYNGQFPLLLGYRATKITLR